MRVLAAAVALCLCPVLVRGEIVSWTDEEGVRHYTNVRDDVPEIYLDTIETVVKDTPRRSEPQPAESAPAYPGRRERPRMAQVVYGDTRPSEDYVRGFLEGVAFRRQQERGGIDIDITGPLAVAAATGGTAPRIDAYVPGGYPFVTTAFDRGRSRHLTLRMLLQDQFQMDRGAPYIYEARFLAPGLGLDLNPFHPRGLPRRFPRDLRVIRR